MKLRILQLKDPEKIRRYGYMPYDYAAEHGFDLSDYECVWEESVDSDTSLDDIWSRFQHGSEDCPDDYESRSMSEGDIIDLDGYLFYCEPIGWKELKKIKKSVNDCKSARYNNDIDKRGNRK